MFFTVWQHECVHDRDLGKSQQSSNSQVKTLWTELINSLLCTKHTDWQTSVILFLHSSQSSLGSKGFGRQKCHFSFLKKCKFCRKFRQKSRILLVFRHPKMRPFQQCITVTAVNLFYEVLPKQFEASGFYFSEEKKNRWLLNIGYPEQLLFLQVVYSHWICTVMPISATSLGILLGISKFKKYIK